MNPLPGRFTGVARFAASFRPSRSASTSPAHRSFRLTRSAKEKMIGRTMPHGYITQPVKKEMKTIEEEIVHAVGRGDKTFTDKHGVVHKITDDMRFFAKETQQSGHTLTEKSKVGKFVKGEVEFNREFEIDMKSGYNIGSIRDVTGKIVKSEEASLPGGDEHHSALRARREKNEQRVARHLRMGLQGNSMAAGALPAAPTGDIQGIQPLAPGMAPAKPPTTNRPIGLTPGIIAGRHTDTHDHVNGPFVVAPARDPIAEENQRIAESIPPVGQVVTPSDENADTPTKDDVVPTDKNIELNLPF